MAPLITKNHARSKKPKRKTEQNKKRHLKRKRGFRCSKECASGRKINSLRLPCLLCNKDTKIRRMSISACGHVFCNRCFHEAVRLGTICPTCGKAILKRKRTFQSRCVPGCDEEELLQQ